MEAGLCACGCGQPAPIASQSSTRNGWKAGQPKRYINGHNRRKSPVPYVVDLETGCWVWQGSVQSKGYGMTQVGKERRLAHRAYYETHVGSIPPDLQIDHKCGNKLCVNPHHLEPVTGAENVRRGRHVRLTKADVELIRSSPLSGRKLAKQLGVSHETVNGVRRGLYWKD